MPVRCNWLGLLTNPPKGGVVSTLNCHQIRNRSNEVQPLQASCAAGRLELELGALHDVLQGLLYANFPLADSVVVDVLASLQSL